MTAIPPSKMGKPVGELKKLVSLVDRGQFDSYVYPSDSKTTFFQPDYKPYHNFTQDTLVLPFKGNPAWGQRITFEVPWPWQGDFINSITLRLKPESWLTPEAQRRIGPDQGDWVLLEPDDFFIWADSLGSVAIEQAQMEVDGVIVEQFSGDWINVWNKTSHDVSAGLPYDDALLASSSRPLTYNNFQVSDDGYVYCYLPFAFSKFKNAAFPIVSCSGPATIRFHITLRKFQNVVRKVKNPKACDETPLNKDFQVRDYSFPFRKNTTVHVQSTVPGFLAADMLLGVTYIDGDLRKAYIESPHELFINPVVEAVFNEPLKYVTGKSTADTIQIGLPLTQANGPIRQILFFLRRKAAVEQFADYNSYGAVLENQVDPVWNPQTPILASAQLMIGTAVWADEDERWWRAVSNILMPGGVRGYGNYIYGYNFAEKPYTFDPSGSVNASRVDMRLNLTVKPPKGTDTEWTVHVFFIGSNWMRFQAGLANMLFMD